MVHASDALSISVYRSATGAHASGGAAKVATVVAASSQAVCYAVAEHVRQPDASGSMLAAALVSGSLRAASSCACY